MLLRHSGRSLSSLSERLESTLKSRSLPILHDYLTPQPSHLLNTTLLSYLPFLSATTPARLPSITSPCPLPPAHHLVYFPTPTTPSSLLPDGTDTLHSPGEPFTQRLWAGGHIRFPHAGGPLLDGTRAALVESIREVRTSGLPGLEKVFVGVERRIVAPVEIEDGEKEDDHHVRTRLDFHKEQNKINQNDVDDSSSSILTERRDLCFLRPQNSNSGQHSDTTAADTTSFPSSLSPPPPPTPPRHRRPLNPPSSSSSSKPPQFIHALTPDPVLLFRFSALTYNAHAIHLDPLYTRAVYRQPALLVHGPLLLTLMLTCLKHELEKIESESASANVRAKRVIREITYRCLAPVYVGEGIRICGRKVARKRDADGIGIREGAGEEEEWEVWVEKGGDPTGDPLPLPLPPALVVRGTVRTGVSG